MNKIPVVFCFDDNLVMQAGVCMTSLLLHANHDTFYDIYIFHSNNAQFPVTGYLNKLKSAYPNCNISYKNVGDSFDNAYETRGITIATYYRLLIPDILPQYEKVFYFDVDIIFRNDLTEVYNSDLADYYVAGVATPISDITDYVNSEIGMQINEYICGGTLLFNSKKIRKDNLIPRFIEEAKVNRRFQDQDVLNIVCKGKIKCLPPWFGMVGTIHEIFADPNQKYYSEKEVQYALKYGILHYNGGKPWVYFCYNFDIWWEYYRKSIFFDLQHYHNFYVRKMREYDTLTLMKRIKVLVKYFVHGRLK